MVTLNSVYCVTVILRCETVKESTTRADFAALVLNVLLVRLRSSPQIRPARDDSFTVSALRMTMEKFSLKLHTFFTKISMTD